MATALPESQPALEGYTFEGFRNPGGSVGTRNILAITQTVQCVAGITDFAVQRIKAELLPRYPNVDDVLALDHGYGCSVAANPAVGFCTDLLVRAGASVMFSETTEVRDGIDQLTARASTPEVANAMIREMAWYDAYLQRGGVDRSANTTPGNKAGGLSNIVEKAISSIVKSGSMAITGVLAPGEKLRKVCITVHELW